MAIIVSHRGSKATVLEEMGVQVEAHLEEYVAENPECLPVHDIKDEKARLMIVARQFGTDSGPIDVLAIDSEGGIYVIETKLYKNPDKRFVVAQVLDYGAALWHSYSDPATFITELDRLLVAEKRGELAPAVTEFFKFDEEQADTVIERIKANLQAGNIRFLVLMNRLHDRLKNLILFLNQRSGFHIYAVEMEFYERDDLKIVIPKLFGTEAVKTVGGSSGGSRKKWNESSFFEEAKTNLKTHELAALRKVYDFSKTTGDVRWGTSKTRPAFTVGFTTGEEYYVGADGIISVWSIWLPRHGKDLKPIAERVCAVMKEAGLDVSKRGMDDDSGDLTDQWVPRVDDFIATIRRLVSET